jgi:Mrp family chromosome partitioning ATPase
MSALDQAFIKAYAKHPTAAPASSAGNATAPHASAEIDHGYATDAYSAPSLPPYRLDQAQPMQPPHARFARTGNTLRSRYTAPPAVDEFLPPPPPSVQQYPELLPTAWKKKSPSLTQLARQLSGNAPAASSDDDLLLVQEATVEVEAKKPLTIHKPVEEAAETPDASHLVMNFTSTAEVVLPQVMCSAVDTTALHMPSTSRTADLALVVDTFSEPLAPVVEKKRKLRFDTPAAVRGPHYDLHAEEETEPEVVAAKPVVAEKLQPKLEEKPKPATPLAAWEVDSLEWPEVVTQLTSDPTSYFAQAGQKLTDAVRDGMRMLAVAASQRGEGCTTISLSLARIAAQSGLDVALVDADFAHPEVGEKLKLEIPAGWELATQQKVDLCEVAIRSVKDKLTIYSLRKCDGLSLNSGSVHPFLSAVAARHALVIVDLGPLPAGDAAVLPPGQAAALDAVVIVRDVLRTPIDHVQQVATRLQASGIEAVAIAENFTS